MYSVFKFTLQIVLTTLLYFGLLPKVETLLNSNHYCHICQIIVLTCLFFAKTGNFGLLPKVETLGFRHILSTHALTSISSPLTAIAWGCGIIGHVAR